MAHGCNGSALFSANPRCSIANINIISIIDSYLIYKEHSG